MNMPGFRAYDPDPNEWDPSKAKASYWGAALITAVKNGSVPLSRVDDMVTRTLAAWYKAGQDKNYPKTNFNWTAVDAPGNKHINVQANHKAIVRQVAAAGTGGFMTVKRGQKLRLGDCVKCVPLQCF